MPSRVPAPTWRSIYNLVARVLRACANYRDLTPEDEHELLSVYTPTVSPTLHPRGRSAIRRIEDAILSSGWRRPCWRALLPARVLYRILRSGKLEQYHQIDPKNSVRMLAACEKNLAHLQSRAGDSTTGNIFAGHRIAGDIRQCTHRAHGDRVHDGLAAWYDAATDETPASAFFQIGGGIAATSICVVPMMRQGLCSATISRCGAYSARSAIPRRATVRTPAVPNEKITWEKLDITTPKFIVESDATIVAPLIFACTFSDERAFK